MTQNRIAVTCLLAFASLSKGVATPAHAAAQTIAGLGATTFPTSTKSPEAQTAFMRGLLLLHLFEYPDAAQAFVSAQKLDPSFAMAYWGEAMTHNHGIWNQLNAAAGKAALDKFAPTAAERAARIADPRERAYMAAVELLYDGRGTKPERDKRYSQAMQRIAEKFGSDRNAKLFQALALLSESQGERDVPAYLRAAAAAKAIFRLEPQNPGAAHYWIHGMDDPGHAAGALEAARALSRIAPDAGHSQHMCSHIFIALGMWDDVVQANVEAMRVVNQQSAAVGAPPSNCGHYQEWLAYGYFQQGRFREARDTVAACQKSDAAVAAWAVDHPGLNRRGETPAEAHHRLVEAYSFLQSMEVIEAQEWLSPLRPVAEASALTPQAAAWFEFTRGFAAAQRGDSNAARSALKAMRSNMETARSEHHADPADIQTLALGVESLEGLIRVKSGEYEAGATQIRRASVAYSKMPFAFGPPVTIKPPEELMGEVLLANGDAAAALPFFQQSLRRAPLRALSLLGLARAQHAAGDDVSSRKTYKLLLAAWHSADAGIPGLEEAQKAVKGEKPRSQFP